jgi:hypothetical protein
VHLVWRERYAGYVLLTEQEWIWLLETLYLREE